MPTRFIIISRAEDPFKLNCAAIPESLIESELAMKRSVYERGERCRFELADGGTIFLTRREMPMADRRPFCASWERD